MICVIGIAIFYYKLEGWEQIYFSLAKFITVMQIQAFLIQVFRAPFGRTKNKNKLKNNFESVSNLNFQKFIKNLLL